MNDTLPVALFNFIPPRILPEHRCAEKLGTCLEVMRRMNYFTTKQIKWHERVMTFYYLKTGLGMQYVQLKVKYVHLQVKVKVEDVELKVKDGELRIGWCALSR